VRVGYRIFAAPGGDEPRIPGVTPRCEYGIEILVAHHSRKDGQGKGEC
jgi:hypothetical protein